MRIVIYGAGGFGREVVTAARGDNREIVFLSDTSVPPFLDIPRIALDELAPDDEVVIAVADPDVRRRLAARCRNFGRIVAPTATIGRAVEIGEGSIFCDFAMVTTSAKIGRHFHCNIYSYVAHDCRIGDFVTFAPKVCCNGSVTIGDGAYIGTGATLKQGVRIGRDAIVGMGAVVLHDVPDGATVVGNPAHVIRQAAPLMVAG